MLSSDEFDRRFDSGEDMDEFVDWSQKPVIYNAETLAAIQESEDIAEGKIQTKSYKTAAEMHADILAEAEEDA